MNLKNKLALGTVQFGLDYGISNKNGKVAKSEVAKILNLCRKHDITKLDTAQCYGESEKVLGTFDLSGFKIITKIIGKPDIDISLNNLNVQSVYGLMFHREGELTAENFKIFERYKEKGKVQKIGVSIYTLAELKDAVNKFSVDIVQLPLNILMQDFIPLLPLLKSKGIEIHTRSTFLQGLLLSEPEDIDNYFDEIKPLLKKIPKPKIAYALDFVKNISEIDNIVVGCTSKKELSEIIEMYNTEVPKTEYAEFKVEDKKYTNPSKWVINR